MATRPALSDICTSMVSSRRRTSGAAIAWINPAERKIGPSFSDVGDYHFGDAGDPWSAFAVLKRLNQRG